MRIVAKHLTGTRQGESDSLTTLPLTIGRVPTSTIRLGLNDTRASGRHAEILREGQRILLCDIGSTNGTFINGQRIQRAELHHGDVVEFGTGGPKLLFELSELPASGSDTPTSFGPQSRLTVPEGRAFAQGQVATIAEPASSAAALTGEREFVIKSKFKYYLMLPGIALLASGTTLFLLSQPLSGIPLVLLGVLSMISGLAAGRKNITVSPRGVRYEGFLSVQAMTWSEIQGLSAQRSRTQLLTHQIYIIQGPRGRIIFTPSGYLNGLELAQIITRQTGFKWQ